MAEAAVRISEAQAERGIYRGAAASSLRGAGITFLLLLALYVPLIGVRTEGGLEFSTHIRLSLALAAAQTVIRFLVDILIWRPVDGGRTLAVLQSVRAAVTLPGLIVVFASGGCLFIDGGLRTWLIEQAASYSWLAGTLTDLFTFACIAAFAVFFAMAASRVGRLLLALFLPNRISKFSEALVESFGSEFAPALLAIAVVFPFLIAGQPQRYAVDTATLILIYVMLGWGLNVVVGLAGLLDLGYVAFYAVGAYSYALISTEFGWSFWVCLPLAGLFAALWGMTLGFPVLRLRGDYLAIVTLAFGEIIRIVLINWQSITHGPNGINRIPRPSFFGLSFDKMAQPGFHNFFGLEFDSAHRLIFLYYLILVLALITNFITLRLRRLPIGRAWEALREDEIACRSLGINTVATKLSAFAIGAMFGGLAGSFFAAKQGFISPESFTFNESALVLAIVVLGGLGSQLGVVVAAVILVGSAERFRELQEYRMLIFGLAMVLVMIWRPRGLLAGRTPSASLLETRAISAVHVREGRG